MRSKIGLGAVLSVLGLITLIGAFSTTASGADPTYNASLKESQVGSSNPGFKTGECPQEGFGYHFVLPGNDTSFVALRVTFESGEVVTDFTSSPTPKHAYVYSSGPDTIVEAVAQVDGPETEFVLSHVCTGPDSTTTTTTDETTTTVGDTTTTTADETTTTVGDTTTTVGDTTTTTVPGGVGSDTTVPDTTVPDTTVPDTTVPDTTVPETTSPETTVAGVAPTAGGGNGPGSGVQNEDTNQTTAGPSTAATGGVSSGTLARTGSNPAPWALLGSSLIVAGLVLVGLGNRKRLAEG